MATRLSRLIAWFSVLSVLAVAAAVILTNVYTESLETDVRSGQAETVRRALQARPELANLKLLPQGSRTRLNPWAGRFLIHEVVADGDVAVAGVLAEFGVDLSVRLSGESLLQLAAREGRLEMIRWLIQRGASVNDRNSCDDCEGKGRTPLQEVQGGRGREASELLLSLGADVRAVDAAGRTALHATGSDVVATVLCAHGVRVDQRDNAGDTAFDRLQRLPAADQAKPGQFADWIRPGGGCDQLALAAQPGTVPDWDAVWAAYRLYVCERGQSPELRDCPGRPVQSR